MDGENLSFVSEFDARVQQRCAPLDAESRSCDRRGWRALRSAGRFVENRRHGCGGRLEALVDALIAGYRWGSRSSLVFPTVEEYRHG